MKISKKVKLELYKAIEKEQGAFPSDDKWMKFLSEIWDLRILPSIDPRPEIKNLYDDVVKHTVMNNDWDFEELFFDKLDLLASNEIFIKFLNALVNPNFRENSDEIKNLISLINTYIKNEGLVLAKEDNSDIYKVMKQENVTTYTAFIQDKPKTENRIVKYIEKKYHDYIDKQGYDDLKQLLYLYDDIELQQQREIFAYFHEDINSISELENNNNHRGQTLKSHCLTQNY